jgi:solute carrier family 25 protein 44
MNYDIKLDELDKSVYHRKIAFLVLSARTLLYPLSVIKTRLQYQDASTRQYSGQLDVIRKIFKKEGFRGFYRGYPISLLSLPASLAYIEAMELSWHYLPPQIMGRDAISGLIACTAAQLLFVPSDVLSQRQQIDQKKSAAINKQFKETWNIAKNIYKTQGVFGFYRGFSISMMTYGPQASLFWASYGQVRTRLTQIRQSKGQSGGLSIICNNDHSINGISAGFASVLTNVLITPLDTIRCRYQLNPKAEKINFIIKQLYNNEGIQGFYKGWMTRTLQNFINAVPVLTIWMWIRRTSLKKKE